VRAWRAKLKKKALLDAVVQALSPIDGVAAIGWATRAEVGGGSGREGRLSTLRHS
jgi:hypothetical protein